MIIDGKKIAGDIIADIGESLHGKKLGIVVGVQDPAVESFVRIKSEVAARLGVEVIRLPAQAGGEFEELINECDGVIVQLPHPDADILLAQLPPEKDPDALGLDPLVRTPVVEAIAEIFRHADVQVAGMRAVVVGGGRLVGVPAARFLRESGAEVTVVTKTEGSLDVLKNADIVVLGAGSPGLVKPDMLTEGVVLIDAGTSESNGKLAGDADPACASIARVFTPVPGGVGPIAVACLFKNLRTLVG